MTASARPARWAGTLGLTWEAPHVNGGSRVRDLRAPNALRCRRAEVAVVDPGRGPPEGGGTWAVAGRGPVEDRAETA